MLFPLTPPLPQGENTLLELSDVWKVIAELNLISPDYYKIIFTQSFCKAGDADVQLFIIFH